MYPTRLLLILFAIPAVLSLGLVVDESWLVALLLFDAVLVGLVGLDALVGLPGRRRLRCEVQLSRTWSLGRGETVTALIDNLGRLGWRARVVLDLPPSFSVDDAQREVALSGRSRVEIAFRVTAGERGVFTANGVHIAVTSRLGLWRRHRRLGDAVTVHIYPNLKQLGDYALLARTNRLALIGVRRSRRLGGDTEFERLRDYHSDDAIGRVDWKATARRDQLTVRDYQTSQSQSVMLMVDSGRMMVGRSPSAGGTTASLLDHAIDAALMLAFVALKQGDRVGLIAYADGVKRFVPARGGMRQLNLLIHALHDVQPTLVESRHEDAFTMLERRERKRTLVVALTHVLDDVNALHLQRHCANLVGRHLPLAVLLQDHDLHDPLRAAPEDEFGFWRAGAAAHLVNWRQQIIARLTGAGVLALDLAPERLTAEVVSAYLRVKAKHLL